MRFIIGQWIVIGLLIGVVATVWELVVTSLDLVFPLKIWITAMFSWVAAQILLLIVYWVCMLLMTQKEGKIGGYNLAVWGIAVTAYDIALQLTTKLFLHRAPPIPLLKLYGFKCGKNFSAAIGAEIVDPNLVEFGDNCRIGGFSITCAHSLEGRYIHRSRIKFGNNVEVGARSVVGPGCTGENVVIGAMSFVPKDIHLYPGIYVGVPARKLDLSENK